MTVLLPSLNILTGLLILALLAWEVVRSLRTQTRFGTRSANPRLTRAATPAVYWSVLVMFGLVLGRAGFKFIEAGLTGILAW